MLLSPLNGRCLFGLLLSIVALMLLVCLGIATEFCVNIFFLLSFFSFFLFLFLFLGLRDCNARETEAGKAVFPDDYPDSFAHLLDSFQVIYIIYEEEKKKKTKYIYHFKQ